MSVYGERIARVETEVNELRNEIAEIKSDVKDINHKLDDLLSLKNKGAGVLWLIGLIFGTGFVGVLIEVGRWLK